MPHNSPQHQHPGHNQGGTESTGHPRDSSGRFEPNDKARSADKKHKGEQKKSGENKSTPPDDEDMNEGNDDNA
jgi:hypothetical protein